MKRFSSRTPARAPQGAARKPRDNPSTVFRDFLRQLEKLDARPAKPAREGSR